MVFLELAMAYEAVGRLPEAIKVRTDICYLLFVCLFVLYYSTYSTYY